MSLRKFCNYDLPGMPPVLAWNPIAMRCTPVDDGCRNCWHLKMANRLMKNPKIDALNRESYKDGRVRATNGTLKTALPTEPRIVAVQFMGDLWHRKISEEKRLGIIATCRANARHIFLMLTKRPERVTEEFPDNVWLGTSVHDQASADKRIPELLKAKCRHKWLSIEPMLGEADLTAAFCFIDKNGEPCGSPCVEWVACGAETGAGARPCHPDWIAAVASRCEWNGIPFYDKRDPSAAGFTRREYPIEWAEKLKGNTK